MANCSLEFSIVSSIKPFRIVDDMTAYKVLWKFCYSNFEGSTIQRRRFVLNIWGNMDSFSKNLLCKKSKSMGKFSNI